MTGDTTPMSGATQVIQPATINGQTRAVSVDFYISVDRKTKPSTVFALGEGAKVFGRVAYKTPYILGMFCFQIPSLCTEFLAGMVGSAVGIVVGSTAILARKCMGVRARTFFGLENSKTLYDYVISAQETGARLGQLPGKFVGSITLLTFACSLVVSSSTMIPLTLIATAVPASICGAVAFASTKYDGECCLVDESLNCIQNFRTWFQKEHDDLQGIQRSARDTSE